MCRIMLVGLTYVRPRDCVSSRTNNPDGTEANVQISGLYHSPQYIPSALDHDHTVQDSNHFHLATRRGTSMCISKYRRHVKVTRATVCPVWLVCVLGGPSWFRFPREIDR